MKTLVAAACLVVIGGGGYLAYREYNANQQRERADKWQREREVCLLILKDHFTTSRTSENTKYLSEQCVLSGHIGQDDITRARG